MSRNTVTRVLLEYVTYNCQMNIARECHAELSHECCLSMAHDYCQSMSPATITMCCSSWSRTIVILTLSRTLVTRLFCKSRSRILVTRILPEYDTYNFHANIGRICHRISVTSMLSECATYNSHKSVTNVCHVQLSHESARVLRVQLLQEFS